MGDFNLRVRSTFKLLDTKPAYPAAPDLVATPSRLAR